MKRARNTLLYASVMSLVGWLTFSGEALGSTPVQSIEASAADVNPPHHARRVIRDIVYGQGGGLPLLLDLYLPDEARPPYPAVIFIYHWGGGGQARRHFSPQATYLVERGIASAIISYRSSGPATFPTSIEDAKAAVRWMRANAEEHGIDPDKIAAAGGSAGAQLAALLGTSGGVTELEGTGGNSTYSSTVNLVIAFNGMFDMKELHEYSMSAGNRNIADVLEAYVGGTPEQFPEEYEASSPITHIDERDPPVLLLHGTGDELVPFEQSLRFKEALEAAGVPVELFEAEGAGHGFFNNAPYHQATLERMEEFITKYFR